MPTMSLATHRPSARPLEQLGESRRQRTDVHLGRRRVVAGEVADRSQRTLGGAIDARAEATQLEVGRDVEYTLLETAIVAFADELQFRIERRLDDDLVADKMADHAIELLAYACVWLRPLTLARHCEGARRPVDANCSSAVTIIGIHLAITAVAADSPHGTLVERGHHDEPTRIAPGVCALRVIAEAP